LSRLLPVLDAAVDDPTDPSRIWPMPTLARAAQRLRRAHPTRSATVLTTLRSEGSPDKAQGNLGGLSGRVTDRSGATRAAPLCRVVACIGDEVPAKPKPIGSTHVEKPGATDEDRTSRVQARPRSATIHRG
jgi:hypothetical protein